MGNAKQVNFVFFLTVFLYIAVSFFLSWADFLNIPMIFSMILSQLLVFLPSFVYCLMKKISFKEIVSFRNMKLPVWILVIICTYLMYPLIIVVNAISLIFVESGTAEMISEISGWNFFLATLMMAVMPAFVEEFVFRGVLYGTYRRGRKWLAILVSAFLFGCMHMNFNQFLYAFALGIYMAFLVEATGSILSSMLAHFVINFTSVAMSYGLMWLEEMGMNLEAQMSAQSGNFLQTMDGSSLLIMLIGVAMWSVVAIGTTAGGIGVYIAICKISGRWEHVKQMFSRGTKEKMITISLVITIVLMMAVMVKSAINV